MTVSKNGKRLSLFIKAAVCLLWAAAVVLVFIFRDRITAESIAAFLPENRLLSVCVMLLLFVLKSLTIVVYSGLLYTVNGMIFPLPLALLVDVLGTMLMATVPYAVARSRGQSVIESISRKYPKAARAMELKGRSDFIYCFLMRMLKFLPYDVVSMYLGAEKLSYPVFLLTSTAEMSISFVLYSVAGMHLINRNTGAGIAALAVQAVLTVISLILLKVYSKKVSQRNADAEAETAE